MKKETIDKEQAAKICAAKKTSIGGQALLEGIMMRGPKMSAMAVRNPQGEIVLEKWQTRTKPVPKVLKLPIIRGVYGFISSITMGYKALMRSAEIAGLDEIEEEMAKEKAEKKAAKADAKAAKNKDTAAVEAPAASVAHTEAVTETVDTEDKTQPTDVPESKKEDKKESSALITGIMLVASILGIALAIGLFVMLPTFLYDLIFPTFPK